MIKKNNIAYGVRVKLNDKFTVKCLGDKHLKDEKVLFISDEKASNDSRGYYVHIKGGSLLNSGYAYLDELDLEFEVPVIPLYDLRGEETTETEKSDDIVLSRAMLSEDLKMLQEKWQNIETDPLDDEYHLFISKKANLYGKILVYKSILGMN